MPQADFPDRLTSAERLFVNDGPLPTEQYGA